MFRRAEREQLRPVFSQPGSLLTPPGAVSLDERPERLRVVRDSQVAELVNDDVVDHLRGGHDQPPVEGECPAG